MIWKTTRFDIDLALPKVMGIVNVTPDSFSDGGQHADTRAALAHCERLISEGADLLDIGGESTRPGSPPVPLDQELARVLPVLREAVRLNVPVSVDTSKPEVMAAALELGADIVNDVWALRRAPAEPGGRTAAQVVAGHPACGVCLMHMHGDPQTMQLAPMAGDAVPQVLSFLERSVLDLLALGVHRSRIVVDPGIGFGKTPAQNFSLLARQVELLVAGYPLLVGWSRKSSIGAAIAPPGGDPAPSSARVYGSVAAALMAVERGASVVRVHDVRATAQALRVHQAVLAQQRGA